MNTIKPGLVKHGVENSNKSVSKAPQGSKKHQTDVLNYIATKNFEYGNGPKPQTLVHDLPILKNNINNKPVAKLTNKVPVYQYPTQASPEAFGKLAERVERARQMRGEPKEMSTWELLKKAADTPEEKKEIREIIREDYKKNGAKYMDPDDLKWIGKGKISPPVKIDVSGISESINNYINLTRPIQPVEIKPPPKKQRDPDLELGIASVIGGSHDL